VKVVDLNVLLYAVNRDATHHEVALAWWESNLSSDESVGLPWVVLLGFLRIATNPRIFPRPLDPAEAMGRIDAWLACDTTCVVTENDEHWPTLRRLLAASGTAGNLTTDAHLAALALSHGAVLASFDADFGRFEGLRWENPATAPGL
jgi:hypothetical protein